MAKKTVDEKLAALRVKLVGVEADAEDGAPQGTPPLVSADSGETWQQESGK